MTGQDLLPAILHRVHQSQLTIAGFEDLATWAEQRGLVETTDAAQFHLEPLQANADFIDETIVALMAVE
ncbi:hypothetical protein D3879_14865 [Pseudomonas cavernicola]|uniref:Uncharacterized protein n=1 Tax=Pseudomonas cavernicola TaxID=2320866 RepID=A0A418XF43_9PSED|nr:hypothetical protein [Pseudomonas cavernicola]RJG10958.1 hypothetical protein D3879_14865 [Pseudomonas cavernicola]